MAYTCLIEVRGAALKMPGDANAYTCLREVRGAAVKMAGEKMAYTCLIEVRGAALKLPGARNDIHMPHRGQRCSPDKNIAGAGGTQT